MIQDKLLNLKDKSKLTNQQIADLSGVPISTVNRILSGDTPNPQFQTIVDLVISMGGSLDEFLGIKKETPKELQTPQNELITLYREMLSDRDKQLAERKKTIKTLSTVLFAVVALVMILLTIDILNGNFGYFRY